jgi:ABC-type sugar transport system substrate-binding protein
MKRLLVLVVLISVAALAFAGGKGEAPSGGKITVGFSLPFIEDSPYTFPFSEALKEEAKKRDWQLIMTDAGGDINMQSNQIEDMVSKGVKGIMIMPVDAAGIVAVIKRVYKETEGKLPVICSNVMPDPPELKELRAFAGPNSYLEGKEMGKYYVEYLRKNGIKSMNYCEAQGTAGYSASIDRHNGFLDAVKEMGAEGMFVLLDTQPCDWSPDKAQAQTENWLTTYGSKLQMIYSHNDGMGIGIVNALQNAGLKPGQIITNGCDGQTQAVEYVRDGWMMFTVFQSPAEDGAIAMRTMEKILNGEEVPYWNYMVTPIINKDNAEEYLPIVKKLWD